MFTLKLEVKYKRVRFRTPYITSGSKLNQQASRVQTTIDIHIVNLAKILPCTNQEIPNVCMYIATSLSNTYRGTLQSFEAIIQITKRTCIAAIT